MKWTRGKENLFYKKGEVYIWFLFIFLVWCSIMWHTLCYKWFFRRTANIIALKYCSVDVAKIYFHCGLEALLKYLQLYISIRFLFQMKISYCRLQMFIVRLYLVSMFRSYILYMIFQNWSFLNIRSIYNLWSNLLFNNSDASKEVVYFQSVKFTRRWWTWSVFVSTHLIWSSFYTETHTTRMQFFPV